jgi:hypothetical protein
MLASRVSVAQTVTFGHPGSFTGEDEHADDREVIGPAGRRQPI